MDVFRLVALQDSDLSFLLQQVFGWTVFMIAALSLLVYL
jgi:hypothetical protein